MRGVATGSNGTNSASGNGVLGTRGSRRTVSGYTSNRGRCSGVLGDITNNGNNGSSKSSAAALMKESAGRKVLGTHLKAGVVRKDALAIHRAGEAARDMKREAFGGPHMARPSLAAPGAPGRAVSANARGRRSGSGGPATDHVDRVMLPTTTTSACKDGATSSAEASLSESDIGRAPAISSEDVEMSEPDAEEELEDPQLVAEYSSDIYSHLDRTETSRMPRPDYMESQPEINSKMRAILVDWLVEIHFKFKYKLKMETLFLCVNIVDRYLGLKTVTLLKLQLVGVAGMMIAAKFEEIHPPETKDYVYITDGAFTKEEVMQTEVEMLQALGFDLCAPTVPQYLERYQRAANCSEEHGYLLQYLLELSLLDYKLVRYQPSYLVAAAAFVSNMLLRVRQSWPSSVVKHTSEAEEDIRECASKMWNRFEGASTSPVQAVRWKYSHARFGGVSKKTF